MKSDEAKVIEILTRDLPPAAGAPRGLEERLAAVEAGVVQAAKDRVKLQEYAERVLPIETTEGFLRSAGGARPAGKLLRLREAQG